MALLTVVPVQVWTINGLVVSIEEFLLMIDFIPDAKKERNETINLTHTNALFSWLISVAAKALLTTAHTQTTATFPCSGCV